MLIRSTYQANDSNTNNAPEIKFMEPGRKLIVLTAILNLGTMISPALQIHLKKICAVLVIISLRKTTQHTFHLMLPYNGQWFLLLFLLLKYN